MSKPLDVIGCLNEDHMNGFGWQARGAHKVDGHLVIAFIWKGRDENGHSIGPGIDEAELQSYLRSQTLSKTVLIGDFIGRIYIMIYYTEWALIPVVIQAVLDRGDVCVQIQGNHDAMFVSGERFSFDAIERKSIASLRQQYRQIGKWKDVYSVSRGPHVFLKHYNWHTSEGKILCTEMRAELRPHKPVARKFDRYAWPTFDAICRENKILHYGGWSSFKPSNVTVDDILPMPAVNPSSPISVASLSTTTTESVSTSLPPAPARQPDARKREREADQQESAPVVKKEADTCMICLDAVSTTVVLPCMHMVVCNGCSRKLEKTNDRHVCVQCRCQITNVLYDAK